MNTIKISNTGTKEVNAEKLNKYVSEEINRTKPRVMNLDDFEEVEIEKRAAGEIAAYVKGDRGVTLVCDADLMDEILSQLPAVKMLQYTICNSLTYAKLEEMGVIDSMFYEINDIDLTKPHALMQRPINVKKGDKFVGLMFSSIESAQEYIDSECANYNGFL